MTNERRESGLAHLFFPKRENSAFVFASKPSDYERRIVL
jgi:hypothetical protein